MRIARQLRIYNSEGQYLQASVAENPVRADHSLIGMGISGIKMKVGQPDGQEDQADRHAAQSPSRRNSADGSTPINNGT
ncbi:MAG: hypothetical protein R3D03_15570 [Geminicoccaceae bacterium]